MAVYKVPQDVEADDKLIGPFSFRQFIYLIVVAISMAGAWGLGQLFPVLAILPLPIIVFFGALALPLRKDQPMEAYLSAVVSFYFLKSHKRLWQPDGIDSFVTIIPPKNSDRILTKNLNEDEATKRLNYLANLVDTHGWAIRGASAADTSVSNDLYYESQQAKDMMDETSASAKAMTEKLQGAAATRKQEVTKNMKTATSATRSSPAPSTSPQATPTKPPATARSSGNSATQSDSSTPPSTLPSLEEIRAREEASAKKRAEQKSRDAIAYASALTEEASANKPAANTPATTPQPPASTSASAPATDTIELTKQQAQELSSQEGVTVATIASQAKRVVNQNKTLSEGEEVTISLH
jgi:hypothetical protein